MATRLLKFKYNDDDRYEYSLEISDSATTNRLIRLSDSDAVIGMPVTSQTDSYTLAISDNGSLVQMNNAAANNLTVPSNSSVAFPIGASVLLTQLGAGQTTIVAGDGVTINSAGGALKLNVQYSGATLVKVATDTWYLFGDITT